MASFQFVNSLIKGAVALRRVNGKEFISYPAAAIDPSVVSPDLMVGYFVAEEEHVFSTYVRKVSGPLNIVSAYRTVMLLEPCWEISPEAIVIAWEASKRSIPEELRERIQFFIQLIGENWYHHIMNESLPDFGGVIHDLKAAGIVIDKQSIEEEIKLGKWHESKRIISGLEICSFDTPNPRIH